MNDLTEIKNQFLEDIDEIKRSINDKSEDTPEEIKKVYNSLFRLFKYCGQHVDKYEIIFFFVYFVIRSLYSGPDCAMETIQKMQECIMKHENGIEEEKGVLNLYNEDGSRVTLKELGIEEDEK